MKGIKQIMIIAKLGIEALTDLFEVPDQESLASVPQGDPTTDSPQILSPEMALMQDI